MTDAQPKQVKDDEGDVWTLDEASGRYKSPGLRPRTLDELQGDYGPITDYAPDTRLLLAQALEDVARKLRGAA